MCKAKSDQCSGLMPKNNIPLHAANDVAVIEPEEVDVQTRILTCKNTIILISLSVFLMLFGVSCVTFGALGYRTSYRESEEMDRLAVVLQIGSTGTRFTAYTYSDGMFKTLEDLYCEKQGLTNYRSSELSMWKTKIVSCLRAEFKQLNSGRAVPLHVAATASLRLVKQANNTQYKKMWTLVLEAVKESQFQVSKAALIDEEEQVTLTWVAANYLRNTIGKYQQRYGVIALTNSSLQLAFPGENSLEKPSSYRAISVSGFEITISTHYYRCYGLFHMQKRILAEVINLSNNSIARNPCFFKGFTKNITSDYIWGDDCSSEDKMANDRAPLKDVYTVRGTGNFLQCHRILSKVFKSKCRNRRETCSLQFPVTHGHVLALGWFHKIAQYLHITKGSGKTRYYQAAKWLCSRRWSEFQPEYGIPDRCFESVYVYYLLVTGFKFNENSWRIDYAKSLNGISVDWPFGLIYTNKEVMEPRMKYYEYNETRPGLIMVAALGPVCFIVGLYNTIKACKNK